MDKENSLHLKHFCPDIFNTEKYFFLLVAQSALKKIFNSLLSNNLLYIIEAEMCILNLNQYSTSYYSWVTCLEILKTKKRSISELIKVEGLEHFYLGLYQYY